MEQARETGSIIMRHAGCGCFFYPGTGPSTAKRTELAEFLAFLREGNVLTITKPDRLAHSTAMLLSGRLRTVLSCQTPPPRAVRMPRSFTRAACQALWRVGQCAEHLTHRAKNRPANCA
jgi:hypothetical protein